MKKSVMWTGSQCPPQEMWDSSTRAMLLVQVEFEVQVGHSGNKTGKVGWSPAKVIKHSVLCLPM